MNDKPKSDDPRDKNDRGSLKQTSTPEKGNPEKEQRFGEKKPDLEKWNNTKTH